MLTLLLLSGLAVGHDPAPSAVRLSATELPIWKKLRWGMTKDTVERILREGPASEGDGKGIQGEKVIYEYVFYCYRRAGLELWFDAKTEGLFHVRIPRVSFTPD